MKKPSHIGKKRVIGYNCKTCRGKNFRESGDIIIHICKGFAIPVFSLPKVNKKNVDK